MFQAIQKIFLSVTESVKRFPLPIISSVLAFIFIAIEIHSKQPQYSKHDFFTMKMFLECVCAIPLFTAFSILGERLTLNASTKIGFLLLGFAVLGLHYYSIPFRLFDSPSLFVSRFLLFFISFHLFVSLVAFQKITEIKSFWYYNQYLFSNIIISLLFSVALFAGLGSALLAIDKLFGFNINSNYYLDIALLILFVFNTIFFFINFPKNFGGFRDNVDYKNWLRVFIQYILIPVVLVYLIILYLYLFKIVMYQHYPKGWVCIPILIFSILGILAYLLAYPIRLNLKNTLIYLFCKYFFYGLLPLLSIYFISIIGRIKSYGITEDRYLVLVLGIWLLILSVYSILSRIDNIIMLPLSLLIMLFLSSIGPWGMFQLSIRNQRTRLERNLKRNNILQQNTLVPLKPNQKISEADEKSIHSILDFLNRRGAINVINPWLNEEEQDVLKNAIEKNELWALNVIFSIGRNRIPDTQQLDLITVISREQDSDRLRISVKGYNFISRIAGSESTDTANGSINNCLIHQDTLYLKRDYDMTKMSMRTFLDTLEKNITNVMRKDSSSTNISVIDMSNRQFQFAQDSLVIQDSLMKILFTHVVVYKRSNFFHVYSAEGYVLTQ